VLPSAQLVHVSVVVSVAWLVHVLVAAQQHIVQSHLVLILHFAQAFILFKLIDCTFLFFLPIAVYVADKKYRSAY
jgi:hypothetical protein